MVNRPSKDRSKAPMNEMEVRKAVITLVSNENNNNKPPDLNANLVGESSNSQQGVHQREESPKEGPGPASNIPGTSDEGDKSDCDLVEST